MVCPADRKPLRAARTVWDCQSNSAQRVLIFAPFFVESRVIRRDFLVLCGFVLALDSTFLEIGAVLTVMVLSVIGTGETRALYRQRPGVPGFIG